MKKNDYHSQKEYFSNLAESLKVVADDIERERDQSTANWNNARSLVLFFLSFVVPTVFVFRKQITEQVELLGGPPATIVSVFAHLFSSIWVFIGAAITVAVIIRLYVLWKQGVSIGSYPFRYYKEVVNRNYEKLLAAVFLHNEWSYRVGWVLLAFGAFLFWLAWARSGVFTV